MTDGAIYGLGESLEKETNPLTSIMNSAISGGVTGGITSGISANITKYAQEGKLKPNKLFENITQNELSQYRQQAREYYNNYLKDIKINNKDIGTINLGKKGEREVTAKAIHNAQYFPELKQQLQNAKFIKTTNDHTRKDTFKGFHHLESELQTNQNIKKYFDYEIGVKPNNELEYYITKDITSSRAGNKIPVTTGKSPSLDSAYPIQTRALEPKSNNIIKDSIQNFNPPLWQVEQMGNTANTAIHTNPKRSYDNTQNNYQIWQSGLQNKNNSPVITQRKINNHNTNIDNTYSEAPIVTKRKTNNSNNNPFKLQTSDFFNRHKGYHGYKNPISKDSRIFTAEDIGEMTTDEFTDSEKAIRAQWDTIGIPNHRDLIEEAQKGNLFYMNSYTNPDGTKVKPHFRAKSFF